MAMIKILDPTSSDELSTFRGGGRFIQLLKENLSEESRFVSSLSEVSQEDELLVPFWSPFQKPLLNKKIAKQQILTIFDVIPQRYPQHFPVGIRGTLRLWENKKALKYFDKIITISEASKKDINKFLKVSADKIHVHYLATPKQFQQKLLKLDKPKFSIPEVPFVLYVGDVNWNKNLVNLAKAIKLANIPCMFVGKTFAENSSSDHPWLSEFNQFKKLAHNDHHFIFPGYISNDELVKYYQNALCNILVSRNEGFGLSYLEASTQKCPSVLSDIPVFKEIAEDSALYTNPEDPQDIAEKIVKFKEDGKLTASYAQKAFIQSKKYSSSIFKKRLLEIIGI
ncbi:hypothetical protein A3D06_00655 [Candidatus Roizmanbacteria bacterium RIFCSPHIGHO2_02_FULL_40_9]|uniref:Glycosyl transferase family 1 domain-containing protein n=1 Tax=Candidatus Roizmanbacteria bacterium RIFCSPHIGHO2_02_FULL_40_9 TaxID=1802042 RepID=A0A1F7HCH5_9BACT|nr:MAG: hypothetical protein A3D06_00655 [Candidatus Roizmanbacteria bacterium RIFCSPHIGHO2_02_FULL_40_9]